MIKTTVAVINTSVDLIEILEQIFQAEGFDTCSAFTREFKEKKLDLRKFVSEHKPQIIVYDIAIPYKENYKLFENLKKQISSTNVQFVLTTTNKKALEEIVGNTTAFEIVGKPFDLDQIVKAVRSFI